MIVFIRSNTVIGFKIDLLMDFEVHTNVNMKMNLRNVIVVVLMVLLVINVEILNSKVMILSCYVLVVNTKVRNVKF